MQMNSKWLRRLFGAVVILFVVGIVLPGYATAKSPTGKPVTIVGTTETAGPQVDTLGVQFEGGYALAIKEINDAGGIAGRSVRLKILHEGYSTEEVTSCFKQAVSLKPNAIVGGNEAGTVNAASPIIRDSGIPTFIVHPCATVLQTPGYYDYSWKIMCWPQQFLIPLKDLVEQKGYKRIGILNTDAGYGQIAINTMKKMFPGDDPKIVAIESYTWGTEEMRPELTRIVAARPDMILCGTWGDTILANVERTLQELNYKGSIVYDITALLEKHAKGQLSDLVQGSYAACLWLPDQSVKANWDFVTAYRELNGYTPDGFGVCAYTAMKSMCLAMQKAGTADDPDKIRDAMYKLDWVTPWGKKVEFFPGGQYFMPTVVLGQATDKGIVPVVTTTLKREDYNEPIPLYDAWKKAQGK